MQTLLCVRVGTQSQGPFWYLGAQSSLVCLHLLSPEKSEARRATQVYRAPRQLPYCFILTYESATKRQQPLVESLHTEKRKAKANKQKNKQGMKFQGMKDNVQEWALSFRDT